jgi:hypothetical protein
MFLDKTKGKPLPLRLCRLMAQLSKILGVKEFILFGGAAVDLLLNPLAKIHDIDIGIKGREKYIIDRCKKHLKLSGFQIIGDDRLYFINMNEPVTMVFAKNDCWVLDINFMDNPWNVGQFDAESLFFRYPELDYIDNYGALVAIKRKTIRPIKGLYKENPILLLNRIIHLCSKYNMSMSKNPAHRHYINILKKRVSKWNTRDKFHGKLARIAFYSKVLKAIAQSERRSIFINDLVATGILTKFIPELQKLLKNLSSKEKIILNKLRTKDDIVKFLVKIANPKDQRKLKYKFQLLYNIRKWDIEDQEVHL